MTFRVEADRRVLKRLEKCQVPGVRKAFDELVESLRKDPQPGPPDKRTIWKRPFPGLANHRHANLPGAWRASWTLDRRGDETVVVILFVGTHEEYEQLYGFRKQ